MTRAVLFVLLLLFAGHCPPTPKALPPGGGPPDPASSAGLDMKVGAVIPPDAVFLDEAGRRVKLGSYFGRTPVLLAPVYYSCPVSCQTTLRSLGRALDAAALTAGRDVEIVAVSFDPREDPELASAVKAEHLAVYRKPLDHAGWHYLSAAGEDVERVLSAAGFKASFDPVSGQYAHPAAVFVLGVDGRIRRALSASGLSPQTLRGAVADAAAGAPASGAASRLWELCFGGKGLSDRARAVLGVLRVAGAAAAIALIAGVGLLLRRESKA